YTMEIRMAPPGAIMLTEVTYAAAQEADAHARGSAKVPPRGAGHRRAAAAGDERVSVHRADAGGAERVHQTRRAEGAGRDRAADGTDGRPRNQDVAGGQRPVPGSVAPLRGDSRQRHLRGYGASQQVVRTGH